MRTDGPGSSAVGEIAPGRGAALRKKEDPEGWGVLLCPVMALSFLDVSLAQAGLDSLVRDVLALG